ncbi:hypothetical protein HYT05_01690 [Candidatus Kaiserbacteria bacterium]|nr:hypothetical protein [Candidatus Kaiserbacteria bacterium]
MDPNRQTLNEILQLARDNNKMLHGMRRSAFFWGFMKFLVYMILFAAPIWFYLTYVSGTLDQMVTTINKMQGTAAQAEEKFDGFQTMVKDFREKLPAFMQANGGASSTQQ